MKSPSAHIPDIESGPETSQTPVSTQKNSSFFKDNIAAYSSSVQELDTYARIRTSVDQVLDGIGTLLDIGNGGVFDYETARVQRIIALDLFLDQLPESYRCPPNVSLRTGSALAVPEADCSVDGVLMVMLLHHLIGKTVHESLQNVKRAFQEAYRVLKPGGKLVIVESCIPDWFYRIEKLVFRVSVPLIGKFMEHPATLQYPAEDIALLIEEVTGRAPETTRIPVGKWVLQFGFKVPSAVTPVCPYLFVARKL